MHILCYFFWKLEICSSGHGRTKAQILAKRMPELPREIEPTAYKKWTITKKSAGGYKIPGILHALTINSRWYQVQRTLVNKIANGFNQLKNWNVNSKSNVNQFPERIIFFLSENIFAFRWHISSKAFEAFYG